MGLYVLKFLLTAPGKVHGARREIHRRRNRTRPGAKYRKAAMEGTAAWDEHEPDYEIRELRGARVGLNLDVDFSARFGDVRPCRGATAGRRIWALPPSGFDAFVTYRRNGAHPNLCAGTKSITSSTTGRRSISTTTGKLRHQARLARSRDSRARPPAMGARIPRHDRNLRTVCSAATLPRRARRGCRTVWRMPEPGLSTPSAKRAAYVDTSVAVGTLIGIRRGAVRARATLVDYGSCASCLPGNAENSSTRAS